MSGKLNEVLFLEYKKYLFQLMWLQAFYTEVVRVTIAIKAHWGLP